MSDAAPGSWQEQWLNQRDKFFAAMGGCIAEWAGVDDELFRIFHTLVGNRDMCAIIYYRLPGLNVRLGLVEEIVEARFPRDASNHLHDAVKVWKRETQSANTLLGVRRRVAHHPVNMRLGKSLEMDASGKPTLPPDSWFDIYASEQERIRAKEQKHTPLTLAELEAHAHDVANLKFALRQFFVDWTLPPQ